MQNKPELFIVLAGYFLVGLVLILAALLRVRRWRRTQKANVPAGNVQLAVWAILVVGGAITAIMWHVVAGLIMLLCAQFIPKGRTKTKESV